LSAREHKTLCSSLICPFRRRLFKPLPPLSTFISPSSPPPAPLTHCTMDLPYTASCNPPRRAKRPGATGSTMSGTDRPAQSLPSLAPAISSLTADATPPADDADLTPDVPGPKRRGRKPSTLSRAARESMRRQNHSRIEKARRTKINDALATLRNLVPADAGRKLPSLGDESPDEDDEDDEFGFGNSKTPGSKSNKKKSSSWRSLRRPSCTYRNCRRRSACSRLVVAHDVRTWSLLQSITRNGSMRRCPRVMTTTQTLRTLSRTGP
jgi:hypothetical protein